jgi:hypothetical protein
MPNFLASEDAGSSKTGAAKSNLWGVLRLKLILARREPILSPLENESIKEKA